MIGQGRACAAGRAAYDGDTMTNVPASQNMPPSVPATPNHASPTERYLYELWREQLKQTHILGEQLQRMTSIALGVTFVVFAVVVVPLMGFLLRFIGIRV